MTGLSREWFAREALARLRIEDLFDKPFPVIPVMTRGRAYGSISRRAVALGARIPPLALGNAAHDERFIYVALWDDNSTYTEAVIAACAAAAFREACDLGLPQVFLPVLGGKEGMKHLWAAEKGIFEHTDKLDDDGLPYPEHHYLSQGDLT